MLSDNRRSSRSEVYSMRQKKLSMPLEINAVYINGSVVQKQRSREGVKQSTLHFQRVNGLVQFQPTRRCAVIKAGVKCLPGLCPARG